MRPPPLSSAPFSGQRNFEHPYDQLFILAIHSFFAPTHGIVAARITSLPNVGVCCNTMRVWSTGSLRNSRFAGILMRIRRWR